MSSQLVRLPRSAICDPRLQRNDWRTLLALASHARASDQHAWPSSERLAVQTGLDRRTVRRCLLHLESLGYLELVGRMPNPHGGKGARIWQITDGAAIAPTADGAADAPTVSPSDGAPVGRPLAQPERGSVGATNAPVTKNRTNYEQVERDALAPWDGSPEQHRLSVLQSVRASLRSGVDPVAIVLASSALAFDCSRKAELHPSSKAWQISLRSALSQSQKEAQARADDQQLLQGAVERLRAIHGDAAPAVVDAVVEMYGLGALQSVELVPLAEIAAGKRP